MYYAQNMSFGGDMISETESRSRNIETSNDIKLFGRTIPLLETQMKASTYKSSQVPPKSEVLDSCRELTKEQVEGPCAENSGQPGKDSASGDCKDQEKRKMQVNEARINPKTKEDQAEDNILDQEKVFKKPDKILACPRCNSLDTKFCYFNNYNVNQPRHFCKNCQRYWTAGGTVRNVPMGAGRRKHKNLASQYHQIMVSSDGLLSTSSETTSSINHQLLSCGESSTGLTSPAGAGTVLKFGPETPLCESMETGLKLRDPRTCVEMGSVDCRGSAEEPSSCVSSMKVCSNQGCELPKTITQREGTRLQGSCNEPNVPHPLNCYPLAPWVYPWNPGWRNAVPAASAQSSESICVPNTTAPNQVQLYPSNPTVPMLAVPGSCSPSISLQAVPAWYWGCMPVWSAGIGNVSLSGSNACLSHSSSTSNSSCSGNGSATLGKHSRDANILDDEKSETCILVPKTLRVDDLDEASKSPIWATLGIKPAQKESTSKSNVFTISESKQKARATN